MQGSQKATCLVVRVFIRLDISTKKGLERSTWLTMKANVHPEMVVIVAAFVCRLFYDVSNGRL
jgi:hypothetical protein